METVAGIIYLIGCIITFCIVIYMFDRKLKIEGIIDLGLASFYAAAAALVWPGVLLLIPGFLVWIVIAWIKA